METDKIKVEGTGVTIEAGSEAEAREVAARFQYEEDKKSKGVDGYVDEFLDGAGRFADAAGRPKFVWLAWALAIVGSVVAYISWSRLSVDPGVEWLFGIVGVCIVLGVKWSAGEWASAKNKNNKSQASFYCSLAILGLVIDAFAAAAFQAAVSVDEQTGRNDIDARIMRIEREVRDMTYSLSSMQVSPEDLKVLTFDLDRELARQAVNNAGEPTSLTISEVIGFGTDRYCLPGGSYASYVDRYCPEVIDLHKKVISKQSYVDLRAERDAKTAEVTQLMIDRPRTSSGLALGGEIASGRNSFFRYIPGVMLMLIILGTMVVVQFASKRHPRGATEVEGKV